MASWTCSECGRVAVTLDDKKVIAAWITHVWGERCPEFDQNCNTCANWIAFDETDDWSTHEACSLAVTKQRMQHVLRQATTALNAGVAIEPGSGLHEMFKSLSALPVPDAPKKGYEP